MCLVSNWELFLQEIGPEVEAANEEAELVLFVRRFSPQELTLGPFEEVALPSSAGLELRAKVGTGYFTLNRL
jgi:hypothetical protein